MKKGGLILLLVLLVIGNIFFWSEITGGSGSGSATGMAIKDAELEKQDKIDNYFPAFLILVIIANILYLVSGRVKGRKSKYERRPKNLKEILKLLKNTDIKTYNDHVNEDINHFADMIRMIDPELAVRIYDVTDKVKMTHLIEQRLNMQEQEKSPNELKKEIIELKHELDTFDFSEFEKDL